MVWIATLLRLIGLAATADKLFQAWEAKHKENEAQNDESKIISLSDRVAVSELHRQYDRPEK